VSTILRVDLSHADASAVPQSLRLSTPEVLLVRRVPGEGASARFLVQMATADVEWSVKREEDGFTLLLGTTERVGEGVRWGAESSYAAGEVGRTGPIEEPPAPEELLQPALAIVIGEEQPVRTGPSPLHAELSRVSAGQTRIADARRGAWVHLSSGGWLLHALGSAAETLGSIGAAARRPMAWSVITIGTGLELLVTETPSGVDPRADELAGRFEPALRVARLEVRLAGPAEVGVRLPPKEGRLVLTLRDGATIRSYDPRTLPLREEADGALVEQAFAAPLLYPGESWTTWLLLPGDVDLLDVVEAQVDVDGRLQRLFRVPGSGEVPR
jgi:hypothetical protein